MSIETAIRERLTSDIGVTALVGTRISPEWRREGTALPAIVYSIDSRTPVRTLAQTTSLAEFAVSVDCIAVSLSAARTLAAAVSGVLNDNAGFTTVDGTRIQWNATDGEDVERMDDQEGTDDGPRVVRQTYRIWATGG
jgi:hypothetical protein